MRAASPCPACEKPIPFWRVATAPTPVHIKCPHCMRPLRVKNLTLPLVVGGIGVGLVLGRWLLQEARVVGGIPFRALALALLAVAALDLLFSLAVVNLGRLVKRDG
jgi:hypothetical protein